MMYSPGGTHTMPGCATRATLPKAGRRGLSVRTHELIDYRGGTSTLYSTISRTSPAATSYLWTHSLWNDSPLDLTVPDSQPKMITVPPWTTISLASKLLISRRRGLGVRFGAAWQCRWQPESRTGCAPG